jgi:hypothetical protein
MLTIEKAYSLESPGVEIRIKIFKKVVFRFYVKPNLNTI